MYLKEHIFYSKMRMKKWLRLVSVEDLHNYWSNPDKYNLAEDYFAKEHRSKMLYDFIKDEIPKGAVGLEIGCNVGRNIAYLTARGYKNISGIDINQNAVELGKQKWRNISLEAISIESYFQNNEKVPFIFTMAVLEHLYPTSFGQIKRKLANSEYLVTIEDENSKSFSHYPRNYKEIFEGLGLLQIEHERWDLESNGNKFEARLFINQVSK